MYKIEYMLMGERKRVVTQGMSLKEARAEVENNFGGKILRVTQICQMKKPTQKRVTQFI